MPDQEIALAARATTLYRLEDDLQALLNSIDMAPEDQRLECLDAITEADALAKAKRDNVARYLRTLAAMDEAGHREMEWLSGRQAVLRNHIERVKAYVARLVETFAPPSDKSPRLEGNAFTLALAKNPDSVVVLQESAIPDQFVTVTVSMPAIVWRAIEKEIAHGLLARMKTSRSVSKSAIKKALDAGEEVPGADRKFGAYRLEVK